MSVDQYEAVDSPSRGGQHGTWRGNGRGFSSPTGEKRRVPKRQEVSEYDKAVMAAVPPPSPSSLSHRAMRGAGGDGVIATLSPENLAAMRSPLSCMSGGGRRPTRKRQPGTDQLFYGAGMNWEPPPIPPPRHPSVSSAKPVHAISRSDSFHRMYVI